MIAIYELHNMLAIYLCALLIEYMLAIYYNKAIPNRTALNKPQAGDRHTGETPKQTVQYMPDVTRPQQNEWRNKK